MTTREPSPQRSDLLARVAGLSDSVARQRSDFDAAGQLPDGLFRELAELGLFRLWLPEALGGPELSALEFMDVVEAAAALEGAIGWLAGNGGGMARAGAFLPVGSAAQIFADPAAFITCATGAVGRATRIADGYTVTGRWPFGSGAPHATWFSALCAVEDAGHMTGETIFVYAPRQDVLLHDNWQVSGLCATGSVDFELNDVVVADRFAHLSQPTPTQPGVLYRLPTGQIFSWTVATVPLGIATGAIAEFVRLARSRKPRGDAVAFAEREWVHAQLGQIVARVSASRAHLRHTMTDLLDAVAAASSLEAAQVAFQLACTFASQSALWAIDLMTEMVGSVAISRTSTLERFERDARAAAKHIAMSPNAYVTGGKFVLETPRSGPSS